MHKGVEYFLGFEHLFRRGNRFINKVKVKQGPDLGGLDIESIFCKDILQSLLEPIPEAVDTGNGLFIKF